MLPLPRGPPEQMEPEAEVEVVPVNFFVDGRILNESYLLSVILKKRKKHWFESRERRLKRGWGMFTKKLGLQVGPLLHTHIHTWFCCLESG